VSKIAKLKEMLSTAGLIRAKDLDAHGIPREYLGRLVKHGNVEKIALGLYRLKGVPITEHHSLAVICKKNPKAVVCLLSALAFHRVTTQSPSQIWIAVHKNERKPESITAQLRVVRFSLAALTEGVETHRVEEVPVKVFSIAKTVADCFKYRNKIGLDVAMESLKECRRRRLCSTDSLWKYAKICRVWNVMRPYMEALE
jgi:predicted transcriptional regulator of viral defense system